MLALWGYFWGRNAFQCDAFFSDAFQVQDAWDQHTCEEGDRLAATATVAFAVINADLSVTEAADSLSATVNVIVGLSLAVTEADDALSATASVTIGLSASITEADDSLTAAAGVLVQANLAATEVDDSLTATLAVLVQANASITEAADTLAADASVGAISADLSVTEDDDTLAADASVTAAVVVEQVPGGGLSRQRFRELTQRNANLAVREDDDRVRARATVSDPEQYSRPKLPIELTRLQTTAKRVRIAAEDDEALMLLMMDD